MSIFSQIDHFRNLFIRPSRQKYLGYDLGPENKSVNGQVYKRTDFDCFNRRSHKLKCSIFKSENCSSTCLIYLHCNSGSRLEGLPCLTTAASLGMSLLAFDFSGSGLSEGEYVTLGVKEADDLEDLITFCKEKSFFNEFVLWGRSMGAVTALLFGSKAKRNSGLVGIIADSPFSSLSKLAMEYGTLMTSLPKFIISPGISILGNSIKKKIGFDLMEMNLLDSVKECRAPVLFISSKDDKLVRSWHSEELYSGYGGVVKQLYYIEGDHNDARNEGYYTRGKQFILEVTKISDSLLHSVAWKNLDFESAKEIPANPLKTCKTLINKGSRIVKEERGQENNLKSWVPPRVMSKANNSIDKQFVSSANPYRNPLNKLNTSHTRKSSAVSSSMEFSKLALNFNRKQSEFCVRNQDGGTRFRSETVNVSSQGQSMDVKRSYVSGVKEKIMGKDLKSLKPIYTIYR